MKKLITLCIILVLGNTLIAQSDPVIDHTSMTMPSLKKIFENAYLEVTSEGDGFIAVKDTYSLYVTKYDEKNRYIEFVIFNNFKDGISQTTKYEFVNKINKELIEVTAYCDFEKKTSSIQI